MYAFDFLKGVSLPSTKIYLSGGDNSTTDMVLSKLISSMSISETVNVTKSSDIKVSGNYGIFGPINVLYIFRGKLEPPDHLNYVVKVASSKMPKKYKDHGYCEIVCNGFFQNQIEELCRLRLLEVDATLAKNYSKFLCIVCNYDIGAITNVIKIISYLPAEYVRSLSYQDFTMICGNLSGSDESIVVGCFIDGNYIEFLNRLALDSKLLQPALRNLVYALIRVKSTVGVAKPTWYQNKLLACAGRLESYGLDRLIVNIQNLVDDFWVKPPQTMLRLNLLVKDLREER